MTGLENTSGYKTFTATGTAIAAFVRVALDSSGTISAAGVSGGWIGVTMEPIVASGIGTVKLRNAPGTFPVKCAVAVTRGAQVYTAASGLVAPTGTTLAGLQAFEAATTTGDIIEFVPIFSIRN